MEFTDKIIRSNFKEFNNLTTQEFWELLKINPFLISHIPYPTNNQIEYALAFDTERHNILSSIQNIPVDSKIYKYKEELQKKTKDNDDNDSYCVIPEDRLNRINKTLIYDNHLVNTLGLTKQEIFTMYRDNRGIYDDYINEVKFLQLLQYLDK